MRPPSLTLGPLLTVFAVLASLGTEGCAEKSSTEISTAASTPAPPLASCAAGTMPSLESGACEPVGPSRCPEGFAAAKGGWGCSAIVPAAACKGATRATLGQTECAPVDDCEAPFPPRGATVVHDSAQLAAAIAVADPGATIALETGTYGSITTDQDVTLVGRCASKVIVKGPGTRGVFIQQERAIALRSMTITGFQGGIVASYFSPTVDVSHVVLTGNQIGIVAGEATVTISQSVIEGHPADKSSTPDDGAVTVEIGAKVTLTDVDVRDASNTFAAFDAPGTIEVRRSVVTYDGPTRSAELVQAFRGGAVTITESAVHMREAGFASLGSELQGLPAPKDPKPGSLRVVASEIVQRGADRSERQLVLMGSGSSVTFDRSTVVHQSAIGVLASGPGTRVTLTDSVVLAEQTSGLPRIAVMALRGASALLTRSAVVDACQNALATGHDGSTLTLDHSLVMGTKFGGPGPEADLGGVGMAIAVGDGASLSVVDSAIVASEQFGIVGESSARLKLTRTLVDGTIATSAAVSGVGVSVSNGAQLTMDACLVRGSGDAALMFVDSPAIVQGSRFSSNKVGVHVQGTSLVEVKDPPHAGDPAEVVFYANVFENNATYSRTAPVDFPIWSPP